MVIETSLMFQNVRLGIRVWEIYSLGGSEPFRVSGVSRKVKNEEEILSYCRVKMSVSKCLVCRQG